MEPDLESLVIIAALAVLAPIIADVPRRFRVAIVVIEIMLGILVGPDVLDLVHTDPFTDALASIGLAALFFLAGSEIERPLRLAGGGWLLSLAIGAAAAGRDRRPGDRRDRPGDHRPRRAGADPARRGDDGHVVRDDGDAAGVIYAIATRGAPGSAVLKTKLDAIAFGFLVPVFFIRSGLTFDLSGLLDSPSAIAQLPIFMARFLIARGAPAVLEARHLGRDAILPLGLLSASTLPLVVAISEAGVREGGLGSATAAALVGAAMLTVLVYPAIALALMGRRPEGKPSDDPEPEAL